MADVAPLKIKIDSKDAVESDKQLTKVGKTAKTTEEKIIQLEKALKKTNSSYRNIGKRLDAANKKLKDNEKRIKDNEKAQKRLEGAVKKSAGALKGLGVQLLAVAGILSAGQVLRTIDEYNQLQARVKLVTEATGDYAKVSRELGDISKNTGAQLETTVDVFQRLAVGAKDLGKTNEDVLQLTRVVEQLGALGGASTTALNAGLLQFGQAMSAGIVRAEEFNSIIENLPFVAQKIADGMGLSVGQLRKLVLEGKVLSTDVFDSLLKQADEINGLFAKLPPTIARAANRLQITLQDTFGRLDKTHKITERIAKAIDDTAKFLETNKQLIDDIANFISKVETQVRNVIKAIFDLGVSIKNTPGVSQLLTFGQRAGQGALVGGISIGQSIEELAVRAKLTQRENLIFQGRNLFEPRQEELENVERAKRRFQEINVRAGGAFNAAAGVQSKTGLFPTVLGGQTGQAGQAAAKVQADAGDAKLLEKQKKFREGLKRELRLATDLVKIAGLQGKEHQKAVDLIQARNKVQKAGLEFSAEESERLAQIIVQTKEKQRLEEATKEAFSQSDRVDDLSAVLLSQQRGGDRAARQTEDSLAIERAIKSAGLDRLTGPGSQKLVDRFRSNLEDERVLARTRTGTSQAQRLDTEIQNLQKLAEARKKGVIALQDEIDRINLRNAQNEQTIQLEGTIVERVKEKIALKQREEKLQAGTNIIEDLKDEIKLINQLTQAERQGLRATQEANLQIQQEAEFRQLAAQAASTQRAEIERLVQKKFEDIRTQQQVQKQMEQFRRIGQQIRNSFGNFFDSLISGSNNFRSSLRQLISTLAQLAIRFAALRLFNPARGGFLGGIGSFLGFEKGGVFQSGRVVPFADGGIVNSPTLFPLRGGKTGLMGEKQPEAIVPLHRDGRGQLGVRMSGGGGGGVQQNVTVNVFPQGGGGEEGNKNIGEEVARAVEDALKSMMDDQIRDHLRPGGMLNQPSFT